MAQQFHYGNILSGVKNKALSQDTNQKIEERLNNMQVFAEETPQNLDSFRTNNSNIQSQALKLFKNVDFNNVDELKLACKDLGLSVQVDSVETEYIKDKAATGSMSMYTFTDNGGRQVSITNASAKDCLKQEELSFNDLLKDIVDEVASGSITLPETNEVAA